MKIGSSRGYFRLDRVNFFTYLLNSRESSPTCIYGASAVKLLVLLFHVLLLVTTGHLNRK